MNRKSDSLRECFWNPVTFLLDHLLTFLLPTFGCKKNQMGSPPCCFSSCGSPACFSSLLPNFLCSESAFRWGHHLLAFLLAHCYFLSLDALNSGSTWMWTCLFLWESLFALDSTCWLSILPLHITFFFFFYQASSFVPESAVRSLFPMINKFL